MGKVTTVEEYVARCNPIQRERLVPLIDHMRRAHPRWEERIAYQIPTFRRGTQYIGFSAASKHFSVHSLDFDAIASADDLFPRAGYGKGCVKIPYDEPDPLERAFQLCDRIVARSDASD